MPGSRLSTINMLRPRFRVDAGSVRARTVPYVAMPAWLYGIVGIDVTRRDPLVDPFEKLKATLGTPLARTNAPADPPSSRTQTT